MGNVTDRANNCPICRGNMKFIKKSGMTGALRSQYYREEVSCKSCGIVVSGKSPGKAIKSWNLLAANVASCAAPSVPCLQEPVAFGVRHMNEDDEPEFTFISDDRAQAEAEADTYDGEVVPLYAQPIEVREPAIRECAEKISRHASRNTIYDKSRKDAARELLALLEGR